jgi:hypothetical protein
MSEAKKKARVVPKARRAAAVVPDAASALAFPPQAPPEPPGVPFRITELDDEERPAHLAAWELLDGTDEATIRAAIASESAWVHPGCHLSGDLLELARQPTKADILEKIYGTRYLDPELQNAFPLIVWIDVKRATPILAQARESGVWAGGLAMAIRGLVESGDPEAEGEAWRLFDAASADPNPDLNEWWYRNAAPYALAKTAVTTASLVAKMKEALATTKKVTSQKLVMGIALLLAWRTEDAAAQAAVDQAVAELPEKAKALLLAYAPRNGWKPNG